MKAAMAGDLMRSLGGGRPWILMEQTTNRVNWREVNAPKPPGLMRLWSYQALARGADGVMFFQWRQSRAGAEKFHSAMVPHGPVASSPAWHEVVRLGKEFRGLDVVGDTRAHAEVRSSSTGSLGGLWSCRPNPRAQSVKSTRSRRSTAHCMTRM